MHQKLCYWDRQFKFSEILPDYEICRTWMLHQSNQIANETEFQRIAYGQSDRQWIEMSASGSGHYVPVFVQGGYWCMLEAELHRFVLPGLSHLGPFQANIENRLMPTSRMNDIIDDVAAAWTKIAEISNGRLIVIGHSAGGHLTVAGTRQAGLGSRVAAVVPISGIFDFEPISWSFLQSTLKLTQEEVSSSPLRAKHDTDPPTLAVVGDMETAEYIRQAEAFSAITGARKLQVGGAHHMNVLVSLSAKEAPLAQAILSFIAGRNAPTVTEPFLPL
jgi:arylformamidase